MQAKDSEEDDEVELGQGFVGIDISELAGAAVVFRVLAERYEEQDCTKELVVSNALYGTHDQDNTSDVGCSLPEEEIGEIMASVVVMTDETHDHAPDLQAERSSQAEPEEDLAGDYIPLEGIDKDGDISPTICLEHRLVRCRREQRLGLGGCSAHADCW